MERRFVFAWLPNASENLREISLGSKRFTPLVSEHAPDGIALEITGCAHLFGGEKQMLQQIREHMAGFDKQVSVALSATLRSAMAFARYRDGTLIAQAQLAKAINKLPIETLQLPQKTITLLFNLGISRVKELLELPRSQVMKRFGKELLMILDELSGSSFEITQTLKDKTQWSSHQYFTEAIEDHQGLVGVIEALTTDLCRRLKENHEGIEQLEITLRPTSKHASPICFRVGALNPSTEVKHWMKLIGLRLNQISLDNAIEEIRLFVLKSSRIQHQQMQLSRESELINPRQLSALIDAVTTRIGKAHIFQLTPVQSHLPERSTQRSEALSSSTPIHQLLRRPAVLLAAPAPVRVLALLPDDPPKRIQWKHHVFHVAQAHGPERIESEWWKGDKTEDVRDYFCVEDRNGVRLWVYRTGSPYQWFLHGVFT